VDPLHVLKPSWFSSRSRSAALDRERRAVELVGEDRLRLERDLEQDRSVQAPLPRLGTDSGLGLVVERVEDDETRLRPDAAQFEHAGERHARPGGDARPALDAVVVSEDADHSTSVSARSL